MLRLGCIVLTAWAVLNLIPAAYIVIATTFWDVDSPAIGQILSADEVRALADKERISINSVAVYANCLNVGLSVAMCMVIWFGLAHGLRWAYWTVCLGLGLAVIAGALGDDVLGTVHPEITLISALIFLAGVALAWCGLPRPSRSNA